MCWKEVLITFELPLSEKLSIEESLALVAKQGFQRILAASDPPQVQRLEEALVSLQQTKPKTLVVLQDRVKIAPANRARFIEGCEQGYHFGKGSICLRLVPAGQPQRFSNRLHCAHCDIEYRDPSPALFSFNNPVGACAACKGFGRVISIDYNLAVPDRSRSIKQGVVRPWQTGTGFESQRDLLKAAKKKRIALDVPFEDLPREQQDWVINGEEGYGTDSAHEWPHAWYGVKGYFRWLESKAYKMHVRVQLAKYRCYVTCPECHGQRFKPETLLYLIKRDGAYLTLASFYQLPVSDALVFLKQVRPANLRKNDPFALALEEVRSRLSYLEDVGLGYLTLDRPTRSLSGGETERVNLTTCLGSRLVNTLFVLDEPSVGLHPRDTQRLVQILEKLRDTGNTIVVVEHEAAVMRAANEIIDLGPGQGERGGQVIFQGSYNKILKNPSSLTGSYLSGRRKVTPRARKEILSDGSRLLLTRGTLHNLKDFEVAIPLGTLVCVSGVSGSGKSTLVRELLYPALAARLAKDQAKIAEDEAGEDEPCNQAANCKVTGWEQLDQVIMVDQSSLGRTPRSNPAVYIGAFEFLRDFFADSDLARKKGLDSSAFSFNSSQGQCERCRGAGFEKIEMQFLSDVYIRCPDCNGRRYRAHILEVTIPLPKGPEFAWSIADLLEATVDDAVEYLRQFPDSSPARKAAKSLEILQQVGLGYLRVGQPINTLSGGESQRLKLVRHLADFAQSRKQGDKPSLFIFDEPTTGLHFEDVSVLLQALQKLVDAGHSVLIVEHNLDVIRSADWVIDLGPEAGTHGGKLVAQGPPEKIATFKGSFTAKYLRESGI